MSTESPEFSRNLIYFLKIPLVFQVFPECHKKQSFRGFPGLSEPCKCGVWVGCKCMEFVTADRCFKEVLEPWSDCKKSYLWSYWLLPLIPRASGEHLTSQLSWVAAWLLVTDVFPVHLVGELVLVFCSPLSLGLSWFCWRFFDWSIWFYFYGELMLFYRMGMEFKDKTMLYCFREVKCWQCITTGVWY